MKGATTAHAEPALWKILEGSHTYEMGAENNGKNQSWTLANIVLMVWIRRPIVSWWTTIVRVSVVLRSTVCRDIDWRFDNLSGLTLKNDFHSGCRNVSQCHHKKSQANTHLGDQTSYFDLLMKSNTIMCGRTLIERLRPRLSQSQQ